MPAEGLDWLASNAVLSDDEIVRLASIFLGLGVRTIRLTGGEPLVRAGVAGLVAPAGRPGAAPGTVADHQRDRRWPTRPVELAASGLDRVNVSLDTLDREKFRALTRRDRLADVLAGLAAARAAGLEPIKVNAVLMRDQNLAEAPAAAGAGRCGRATGCGSSSTCRWTPSTSGRWRTWSPPRRCLTVLGEAFELRPIAHRGHAPAEEFEVLDGPGRSRLADRAGEPPRVGIIASVTRPFCRDCDRLRLTADGQLRTCLFAHAETDLRAALRAGASDAELAELIRVAVLAKPAGHGITAPGFRQPDRPMSAIGG